MTYTFTVNGSNDAPNLDNALQYSNSSDAQLKIPDIVPVLKSSLLDCTKAERAGLIKASIDTLEGRSEADRMQSVVELMKDLGIYEDGSYPDEVGGNAGLVDFLSYDGAVKLMIASQNPVAQKIIASAQDTLNVYNKLLPTPVSNRVQVVADKLHHALEHCLNGLVGFLNVLEQGKIDLANEINAAPVNEQGGQEPRDIPNFNASSLGVQTDYSQSLLSDDMWTLTLSHLLLRRSFVNEAESRLRERSSGA